MPRGCRAFVCLAALLAAPSYATVRRIDVPQGKTLDGVYGWQGYQTILFQLDREFGRTYPEIVFEPGDQIWFGAQGCISYLGGTGPAKGAGMGGGGPHWVVAPYVSSLTIDVPGISVGSTALVDFADGWVTMGLDHPMPLTLGIRGGPRMSFDQVPPAGSGPGGPTDADYCKHMGPGSLRVLVRRRNPGAPAMPQGPRARAGNPMDLMADAWDANGLPLNPRWNYEVMTGRPPDVGALCNRDPLNDWCSSQRRTKDEASAAKDIFSLGLLCPGFHVNWTPVTYTGKIRWHGFDNGPGEDDDYNVEIYPTGGAGTVVGDTWIKGEFDYDETVTYFTSPWWVALRNLIGGWQFGSSADNAWTMLNDNDVIAIGLIGFDTVHGFDPELHPIHALAIHTWDDPHDDRWAFFVRNFGDEGQCGDHDHPLGLRDVSIDFPRAGATGVGEIPVRTTFRGGPGDSVSPAPLLLPGKGARLTFHLGSDASMIHGEVAFNFQLATPQIRRVAVKKPPQLKKRAQVREPEESLEPFLARMSPAQRAAFAAKVKKTAPVRTFIELPRVAPRPAQAAARATPLHHVPVPSAAALERHKRIADALCSTFGGRVPDPRKRGAFVDCRRAK